MFWLPGKSELTTFIAFPATVPAVGAVLAPALVRSRHALSTRSFVPAGIVIEALWLEEFGVLPAFPDPK